MRVEFDGFDWDGANLEHATRYGITREDTERAVLAGITVVAAYERKGELRYSAIAQTPAGTPIDVAFTIRNRRMRPISVHKLKRNRRNKS